MNKLEAIDYRAPDADVRFTASLREFGFGVLEHHPVDNALVSRIYAGWLAFFASEEKWSYEFSRETQDGFFSTEISEVAKGHVHKDIKEYFHFYPWGRCPEALRADIEAYHAAAVELASELLTWVERHSPPEVAARFSEPLSAMIEGSAKHLLRVLHYPPLRGDEVPDAIRAAAHEDINLLTILPAASEPGLQVLGRDGRWIEVPCDPQTLVVNIGDMLQEASRGWFPSTTHRVVNPVASDQRSSRMSLPLFLHPRPDVVLSERYTAGAYLDERLRELGVA
ncbi:MAG TPA: 2OG-Fe(II) oxygenase family protein [Pseudomonadales bacterium]|nr:2OG-Fe(II) oxygenase family protein [Pseudomonadales bacterium]